MGYTINNGQQQVTIYPYQDLTSVEGNQILYGFMLPGVYNAGIEVVNGSLEYETTDDQIVIIVKAGTTCVFQRSYTNPSTLEEKTFVAKVVLQDDAIITSAKVPLWRSSGPFLNTEKLVVYADWEYDLLAQEEKYAGFILGAEEDIPTIQAEGKLVLGTLLNHQYFVTQAALQAPEITNFPGVDLVNYYISYEEQENRNLLRRLQAQSDAEQITFSGDGTQISIAARELICSDTIIYTAGLTTYIPVQTTLPDGVLAADVYQLDVLRLKVDEETQAVELEWQSFVKPDPSPDWDFTVGSTFTKSKLLSYLSGFELGLLDPGYLVLVSIRRYTDVPASDPGHTLSKTWPSLCYMPDYYVPRIADVEQFTRWKLPLHEE